MSNAFSQEISNKEKKGDKQYFLYNYDEAIQAYNSSKTLSVAARRRLAESHVKMENFAEAETAYAYLVNNQDAVIHDDYFQYAMVLKSRGKNDDYAMWMNKLVSVAPSDLRGKCYTANHLNYPQMVTDKKTHKVQSLDMNSESQDYGTAFYKNKIVFTSTKEPVKLVKRTDNWTGLPYSSMYQATIENNQFKDIQFFDKKLNCKMHDGPASFNADGTKMAFTTNNQKDKSKDKIVELQIFTANMENGKWTKPVAFPHNNTAYSTGQPHLSTDGKTMYFTSDMPGGFGGTDIYVSTLIGSNDWSKPRNLGSKINTESDEMFPFYEEQKGQLFFASNGHFGLGGMDIFSAFKTNEQFGEPTNMGTPFNSLENDFAFILNPNTYAGYLSSNRSNGKGSTDIYSFSYFNEPVFEKLIVGFTMDTKGLILPHTFILLKDNAATSIDSTFSDDKGAYFFRVDKDNSFILVGKKEDFKDGHVVASTYGNLKETKVDVMLEHENIVEKIVENIVVEVITRQDVKDKETEKELSKGKGERDPNFKLKTIYYDFDKALFTKNSIVELNRVVKFMNDFPNVEVEIASYTDCRGSRTYNEKLSQNRSHASIEYVQKRITRPERIYGSGYGESKLLNNCACEDEVVSDCSEAEHQVNRRTEFTIKK
jgi:outer membrane protein OmpA-like peptidoglycan-associated protein